ncbi:MAG: FecR domain-containing protein [Balneolaceae bacterium]
MNIDRKHWIAIQRYVTGNAGPEERRLLKNWMDEDPENKKFIQEVQEIWNLTPPENFEVDAQQAWEEFQYRHGKQKARSVSRKVSKAPLYMLRTAAVILVSVFAGVFMQYTLTNSAETEEISDFYVMQIFETERGEKARVTFSDGTKVTLNSASTIRFPQEFHGPKREVYLEGEAYFEVAHDAEHPFIVYAQDAEVKVLGTEFNVRGWSEDSAVQVAVREGKVAVGSLAEQRNDLSQVILTKGLYTSVKKGSGPSPARSTNVTNHLRWTLGGLHFENAPFRQVIRDIERRFNVNIEGVDEDLMETPYTGTFQFAELDEVLAVIAMAMEIEFKRSGSNVKFS